MTKFPKTCNMGQIDTLRNAPGAELVGYTIGKGIFDDYKLTVYKSRAALKAFCKADSKHHALVKEVVSQSMLTNRNFERVA
jgi:hypothetical protein